MILQRTAKLKKSSTFLQAGAQSITLANYWHQNTKFAKAIESDLVNIDVVLGENYRRRFVEIEPGARHVNLILKSLGLSKLSNTVLTPGIRDMHDQIERRKGEAQLSPTMTTVFRSCVMRSSFLSQDHADLAEPVKSLSQQLSKPSTRSLEFFQKAICLADHFWL